MKAGWKTSEFWTSMITSILGFIALFGGHATAGSVLATGATVAYAISRGLAKQQPLVVAAPVEIVPVAVAGPPVVPLRVATPMPPK
jgi:hypothetical protein